MAKYDEQLSRMEYLMGYRMPVNEGKSNKIEYFTEGADGKVYGILKEGTKYYIMTTEKGKEQLAESYQYIGGFRYRGENAYTSYNKASKMLEEKMIALNESYGVHKDVSTVDFDRNKKTLETLTEEARTELNRVQRIMENSEKLVDKGGNWSESVEDIAIPEIAKAENTFDGDKVEPNEETPVTANDGFTNAANDIKEEGIEAVVGDNQDGTPVEDVSVENGEEPVDAEVQIVGIGGDDDISDSDFGEDEGDFDDFILEFEEKLKNVGVETEEAVEGPKGSGKSQSVEKVEKAKETEEAIEGPKTGKKSQAVECGEKAKETEEAIEGPNKKKESIAIEIIKEDAEAKETDETMKGPKGTGKSQAVEDVAVKVTETEEAVEGPKGNGEVLTCDDLNEAQEKYINNIIEGVVRAIMAEQRKPKKKTLQERVMRMVREELNVWGDHPRYRQQPMTTPPDKEVIVNSGDRDWNDASAKGDKPYGEGPGEGVPFMGAVKLISDDVFRLVLESLKGEKKK